MKPKFRCGTQKAIDELSKELNIPFDTSMQDWSYTEVDAADIEKYISHYSLTNDDDKKFVLMEFIIQATNDQATDELFLEYCEKIKLILKTDFKLHAFTIHYWACFENEKIEDCFKITTLMREIWASDTPLSTLSKLVEVIILASIV